MTWIQFSHEFRRDPLSKGSPEALVVLVDDLGAPASRLGRLVDRWAMAVPSTAFFALDLTEQPEPPSYSPSLSAMLAPNASNEPTVLDRASRHLESMLRRRLCFYRLDAPRLVLVGFGYGGTIALHMTLRQGWDGAGVLAFTADIARPRRTGFGNKVRLVECMGDGRNRNRSLQDSVALLTARGIDTRGVSLPGPFLSEEAIRHSTAYLVELVANAQRGDRCELNQESSYA